MCDLSVIAQFGSQEWGDKLARQSGGVECFDGTRDSAERDRSGNAVDYQVARFLESPDTTSGARAEETVIGSGGQVAEYDEVCLQLL